MKPAKYEEEVRTKMISASVSQPAIDSFLFALRKVQEGDRGMLPESAIEPVENIPSLENVPQATAENSALFRQLAVIKLNGGLGTGMGLDKAKSLIRVKGESTFLDFIARQILYVRAKTGSREPAFYLMDSFATQSDTLAYLGRYPDLGGGEPVDFLQNMVPKLDATTLAPIQWPKQPELEWCPPGHGDLYAALLGTGLLKKLLERGIKYLFVSNSDNLGATADARLVQYFAKSDLSFLMEVATRTAADKKGGHLARNRSTGRLLLRESAQCPKEDEAEFQNTSRHRYFNTNNLWIRLDHLMRELDRLGGTLPLPLITNGKTVDPKDAHTPRVLQLESAMGAAIECFERAGAMLVPRSRFAPVKTTSDLLALRSDAYQVTEDHCIVLATERQGQPPLIDLDAKSYKLMNEFDQSFAEAPSLKGCTSLKVTGAFAFQPGVICQGKVELVNTSPERKVVPPGTYRDQRFSW